MAQNNTIHNILEVVVGTADIRSSKKDLRHLRNLRDKKRPKKNLCKSVKSVGHFPTSGVSATTGQVASAKFRE